MARVRLVFTPMFKNNDNNMCESNHKKQKTRKNGNKNAFDDNYNYYCCHFFSLKLFLGSTMDGWNFVEVDMARSTVFLLDLLSAF